MLSQRYLEAADRFEQGWGQDDADAARCRRAARRYDAALAARRGASRRPPRQKEARARIDAAERRDKRAPRSPPTEAPSARRSPLKPLLVPPVDRATPGGGMIGGAREARRERGYERAGGRLVGEEGVRRRPDIRQRLPRTWAAPARPPKAPQGRDGGGE